MTKLAQLLGYQAWKEAGEGGLKYPETSEPEGIRMRHMEHMMDMMGHCEERSINFDFLVQSMRYAAEVEVFYGRTDKKQTRRTIQQLTRWTAVVNMVKYRSWLHLNTTRLYPVAERVELRKVYTFLTDLRNKMLAMEEAIWKEIVASIKAYEAIAEETVDTDEWLEKWATAEQREMNETGLYLADIHDCLDRCCDWLGIEIQVTERDHRNRKAELWEHLVLTPDVVANITGKPMITNIDAKMTPDGKQIMTSKQVAAFLGLTEVYMKQMRSMGSGPAYTKVPSWRGPYEQNVVYDVEDILSWLQSKPHTLRKVVYREAPAAKILKEREIVR